MKSFLGRRFFAGLIDYALIYFLSIIMILYLIPKDQNGLSSMNGLYSILIFGCWSVLTVGVEIKLGATFGNTIVGIKPIPKSGINRKLTFLESFKRHLLDPIDMFFFGLVGFVVIQSTEYHQRVGDLWADTIVVSKHYIGK
ncbi:RDD family protein [Nonlabens antarcticus]|uniref:RDD family protein n=1 Tax=Nonlabens antarcticus TaxID=392714 RepID=UPI0018916945|nr:RDD family protein [Nonlabens antarcticus]